MKKRILALALTLAMVVTSLSMLSFVSFAAGEEATATDFYAYQATVNVDNKLGTDEAYVPVMKEIVPALTAGMAWDYENVYVIVYQEPSTNGVAGARVDYLKNVTVTVGEVVVNIDFAAETPVTSATEGVKGAVGELAGDKGYDFEIAVPLSALTLDADQLANGVAALPVSFAITQMVGPDAESVAEKLIEKDYNMILSGRSLITSIDNVNPQSFVNGINAFSGGHVFDRLAGASIAGTTGIKSVGGSGSGGTWVVRDESTYDGKVEILRNLALVSEYINVADGGEAHYEMEFTINNLPVNGTFTSNDTVTTFNNKMTNIQIASAGAHSSSNRGNLCWIYNDPTLGLALAYYNGTGTPSIVDLGVDLGESFMLGVVERDGSANKATVDYYVNDVLVASYTGAMPSFTLSQNCGSVYIAAHRGNSGVGTNGYSLDIDNNGKVDADEVVDFKMTGFTLSNLNEVDVATLASLTKNDGAAPAAVLLANYAIDASEYVNVASLSKAYAYYDYAAKTVTLAIGNANLDKLNIDLGGFKATVTYAWKFVNGQPDVAQPALDITSAEAGATVACNRPYGVTLITVPMNKMVITKDNTGAAVVDLSINVVKEDQLLQNPGAENEKLRMRNYIEGTWEGQLVFDLSASNVDAESVTQNGITGTVTTNADGCVSNAAATSANFADSSALSAVRTYWQSNSSALGSYGDHSIVYTMNVAAMNDYDFGDNYANYVAATHGETTSGLWGNFGAHAYDVFKFVGCGNITADATYAGALVAELINDTNDGLILAITALDGTVTFVVLGDVFAENVDIKFEWAYDNTVKVYVNNTLKATVANGIAVKASAGKGCYLASGPAVTGYAGFNYLRSTEAGTDGYTYFKADISNFKVTWTEYIAPAGEAGTVDGIVAAGANAVVAPTVRMSYVQASDIAENAYDIRFVATINTLNAAEAGYEITLKGSDKGVQKLASNTVYTSIRQNVDGKIKMISAADGEYLVALTVTGVAATGTYTFTVKPYIVGADETTTYGQAYDVTYTDGALVSIVAAN